MEKVKEPLTLDLLFSTNCSNLEDFEEYTAHQKVVHQWLNSEEEDKGPWPSYRGWNKFDITLHCTRYIVIARLKEDGTYEIRDYITEDH